MRKFLAGLAVTFIVLALLAGGTLFVLNEYLAALVQRQLNAHVQGYQFTVGKAHLYPSLALDVEDLVMRQSDHPEPAVASIPKWHFSIQWHHIFSGVLVSDYLIERPTLHITLPQAKKEIKDEVPVHKKGWR